MHRKGTQAREDPGGEAGAEGLWLGKAQSQQGSSLWVGAGSGVSVRELLVEPGGEGERQ